MWQNEPEETNDLNLMPVISVLAVCISFLLITAVWVQVGTFDLKQAMGTESTQSDDKEKSPTLWAEMSTNGTITIQVKTGDTVVSQSRTSLANLQDVLRQFKGEHPDMNVALVLPAPNSKYETVIALMNGIKKEQIHNIGIAPL